MIDPIAIGETKEHVSKFDKGKNPTIWLIGSLDSITKSKITASMINMEIVDGKPVVSRPKNADLDSDFTVVQHGLKGFKNFGNVEFKSEKKNAFGEEIEMATLETIRQIPISIIRELSEAIWGENQVAEELEKN